MYLYETNSVIINSSFSSRTLFCLIQNQYLGIKRKLVRPTFCHCSALRYRNSNKNINSNALGNNESENNQLVKMSALYRSPRLFQTIPRRRLHLVQFIYNCDQEEKIRAGYLDCRTNIIDINEANKNISCTLLDILRNGQLKEVFQMSTFPQPCIASSEVTLKAPIHGMDKILGIGLNYKDHCKIHNLQPPKVPMVFSKFSSTIIGPCEAIKIRTDVTKRVDYEVELCVVIGSTCNCVEKELAFEHVMGYTVAQDITARDWQKERNSGQFLLGKSMDTFCPIGPWIVTRDYICDPMNLHLSTVINGRVRQCGKTSRMIFKIPALIERISSVMTLYPGDLILTGTPAGIGLYRNPPQFLAPGDIIKSTIENIGVLQNVVERLPCPRPVTMCEEKNKKKKKPFPRVVTICKEKKRNVNLVNLLP